MTFLDTSAVIELLRGAKPPARRESETIGISTIVEEELWIGVYHGGGEREERRVKEFLQQVEIFTFDQSAARSAAKVVARLWKLGRPIGDLDAQIAGHSLALEQPLLTANLQHFQRVEGLTVIPWADASEAATSPDFP